MNEASLKAKLNSLAVKLDKPSEYVIQHYMIERILYRLSISKYAGQFVLKGGVLLHVIFDNKARTTRDIDFLARAMNNEPDHIAAVFKEICQIEADDCIVYDTENLTAEIIKEEADYQGVRVKVTGYIGRTRSVLQMDVGFGDIIVPKPEYIFYPSLLNMEEPELLAYSKESIISEKFQAMVFLAQSNSRMKDFYDIYMMAKNYSFDGAILAEAVKETLTHRKTILPDFPFALTEEMVRFPGKQEQWKAFCKRLKLQDVAFESVISVLREFLMPVYQAVVSDKPFHSCWNKERVEWEKRGAPNNK